MCIIACKPIGSTMPSTNALKNCWAQNNDGAGFAYVRHGSSTVVIHKGFMKLKALLEALDLYNFGVNDMVVLHFRFATHGYVDKGNTHPFPLSSNIEDLRATTGQFNTVIAHNGVFGSMPEHETLSDTQKFIKGILCNPLIKNNLSNPAVQELLRGYCGYSSKLAILTPDDINLIGEFESHRGIAYSNDDYKPRFVRTYPLANDGKDDDLQDELLKAGQCQICMTHDAKYQEVEQCYLCDNCIRYNLHTHCC
jgi:hypothetical protein